MSTGLDASARYRNGRVTTRNPFLPLAIDEAVHGEFRRGEPARSQRFPSLLKTYAHAHAPTARHTKSFSLYLLFSRPRSLSACYKLYIARWSGYRCRAQTVIFDHYWTVNRRVPFSAIFIAGLGRVDSLGRPPDRVSTHDWSKTR